MKKRVLVGVGVAAVAGVLLWPRHPKKDAPPDRIVDTAKPSAVETPPGAGTGESAKRHPRPVMDETKRRQVAQIGRLLRALPEAETARKAEEDEAARKAAAAVPESEADPTLHQSKQAFGEGYDLFAQRRYADAAERFLAAYDLVPYPEFLYDAAVSYDNAGNCPTALEYVSRYAVEVHAEENERVKQRIADIRQRCTPP